MKRILCFVIFYSGIVYLLRLVMNMMHNNPIFILYTHRVIDRSQDFFPLLLKLGHMDRQSYEEKIDYLAKRYKIVSLREYLGYMEKGNPRPRNCVALVFDDGHYDVYRNAYPIFKERALSATIFLTAGLIGGTEVTWFDKVCYLIFKTMATEFQVPDLSDRIYSISSDDDRIDAVTDLEKRLKKLNSIERNPIIEKMAEILKVDLTECKDVMLLWEQVVEMSSSGLIEFGSHGLSHPILTNECEEDMEYEIAMSRKMIEQKLEKPITTFAYPDGQFNELVKEKVKKNGYLCGISCIPGSNDERTDLLEIRRVAFFNGPLYLFSVTLACLPWLVGKMARKRGYDTVGDD